MPRNPLIEDLNVALPAMRRANALDIEPLEPKGQRRPKASPTPTQQLPQPPWICPLCGARLPSAPAMIEHNHGPKGPIKRSHP